MYSRLSLCQICCASDEDTVHILRDYQIVKNFWMDCLKLLPTDFVVSFWFENNIFNWIKLNSQAQQDFNPLAPWATFSHLLVGTYGYLVIHLF